MSRGQLCTQAMSTIDLEAMPTSFAVSLALKLTALKVSKLIGTPISQTLLQHQQFEKHWESIRRACHFEHL